jgi:hypothetical protein
LYIKFNKQRRVEAWDKKLGLVFTLPIVSVDDLLGFVVNIVNERAFSTSIAKAKGAEHRVGTEVENIVQLVVVPGIESTPGLTDSQIVKVEDKIAVELIVNVAHQPELVLFDLPDYLQGA